MTALSDDLKGWGVSIVFHLLLLLIFFFYTVRTPTTPIPQEIDVSFVEELQPITKEISTTLKTTYTPPTNKELKTSPSTSTSIIKSKIKISPSVSSPAITKSKIQAPRNKPIPPIQTRRASQIELPQQAETKHAATSVPSPATATDRKTGTKESALSTPTSDDNPSAHNVQDKTGSAQNTSPSQGNLNLPVITWSGGMSRQRVSGQMPNYPEGVNKEVQIVVRFTVSPDGTVKQTSLVRKGEPRFEERVLSAMQSWKFNKLPATVEQIDQAGTATFNFKLR